MTCRELIDFLAAYLDGELPPDERARFDAHLGECPECVAYLATYRDTIALAKGACAADPTPDVPERLARAIAAARKA
jgi:anti-sigma factor (TIGR02949 family)